MKLSEHFYPTNYWDYIAFRLAYFRVAKHRILIARNLWFFFTNYSKILNVTLTAFCRWLGESCFLLRKIGQRPWKIYIISIVDLHCTFTWLYKQSAAHISTLAGLCFSIWLYKLLLNLTLVYTASMAADYMRSGYYHPQHKLTLFKVPNLIAWVGWNA